MTLKATNCQLETRGRKVNNEDDCRIMSAFCLPVTFGKSGIKMKFGLSGSVAFPEIARWIVSVMGGEGNKTQVSSSKCLPALGKWGCL